MKKTESAKYYLAASLAIITFIAYLPALRNEFLLWDDDLYVYENHHIGSLGPSFFKWALFDFHAGNWHPLTWMSHAGDYTVWGLTPMGHHLTNILLHSINTFVVVFLIIRLLDAVKERTEKSGQPSFLNDRTMLIAAGVTGILFGLHPVHVESVAWVSERKDLLCALFFLLSIGFYITYAAYRSNKNYMLSLVFFTIELLSKPMAVTVPAVLLIDWYPLERVQSVKSLRAALTEKIPFIVWGLGSSVLTVLAQRAGNALASAEAKNLLVQTFRRRMIWGIKMDAMHCGLFDNKLWTVGANE